LYFDCERGTRVHPHSTGLFDLAESWKIPFLQGGRIDEHIDFLRDAEADIGVSMNYTSVIPQTVIDLFPIGILNAHGGDLPRYRGNACQAWAILNGEERIGLCIHTMIGEELDSGDIIARDYLTIDHNTKVTQVWEWIGELTPVLIRESVEKLDGDPDFVLERQSKDPSEALRCYPRKPGDGRIDWCKSAIDVLRLINASNKPYAGAFCDFEGEKMIIWDAEFVGKGENFCAVPGQITKLHDNSVEVACGSGKLKLIDVEFQKRRLRPRAIINSTRARLN
jgi:UDP-4-amino-4-deoxy-L-arabinose formyltransferase/UDP-glucuronic acid dehydrogenase (UDP-4-keto-hexauronic acid decarboxylating)